MSIAATNWVWALEDLPNATVKLVLMKYADHAHDDGTHTWQSIKKVAKYALCSERTAQRAVAYLVDHGYMREGDQSVIPDHYDPRNRPIAYELAMGEATRLQWEVENAASGGARRQAAAAAGKKGAAKRAAAKAQVSGGDDLSPPDLASTATGSGGDNLSPQDSDARGDNQDKSGVTESPLRGDTGVTQTTPETTQGNHPGSVSSLRSDTAAPDSDGDALFEPDSPAASDVEPPLTEAELDTGRGPDGKPLAGKRLDALAKIITNAWWDWIEPAGHAKPAQSWVACRGIIRAALGNGIPPKEVKHGLARITIEGRAVTGASLQIAMQAGKPGTTAGMRRGGYDDVATWGADRDAIEAESEAEVLARMAARTRQAQPPAADAG